MVELCSGGPARPAHLDIYKGDANWFSNDAGCGRPVHLQKVKLFFWLAINNRWRRTSRYYGRTMHFQHQLPQLEQMVVDRWLLPKDLREAYGSLPSCSSLLPKDLRNGHVFDRCGGRSVGGSRLLQGVLVTGGSTRTRACPRFLAASDEHP
jgi:hypothetical protein